MWGQMMKPGQSKEDEPCKEKIISRSYVLGIKRVIRSFIHCLSPLEYLCLQASDLQTSLEQLLVYRVLNSSSQMLSCSQELDHVSNEPLLVDVDEGFKLH